jgi:hypothetical protein
VNEEASKSEFVQNLGKAREELNEALGQTEAAKAAKLAAAKVSQALNCY